MTPRASLLWAPLPQLKSSSTFLPKLKIEVNFGLRTESLNLPELAGSLLSTSNEYQSERRPASVRNQGGQRVVFETKMEERLRSIRPHLCFPAPHQARMFNRFRRDNADRSFFTLT